MTRPARTIIVATGLGALILGLGGRVAMHLVARLTTGTGSFTVGGTLTVILLGAVSGAAGGALLVAARALFRRWPPTTTITYWAALLTISLRGLKPIDELRLLLFLPLVLAFGVILQVWTFRRIGSPRA
ncbi:MAG: hypothetical protein ACRENB_10810 [Gemmatimonadales bacterium]